MQHTKEFQLGGTNKLIDGLVGKVLKLVGDRLLVKDKAELLSFGNQFGFPQVKLTNI